MKRRSDGVRGDRIAAAATALAVVPVALSTMGSFGAPTVRAQEDSPETGDAEAELERRSASRP